MANVFRRANLTPWRGDRRPILTPLLLCQTIRCWAAGGGGLKRVDTIARIRRSLSCAGQVDQGDRRELHVSRNTVRKVLRSGETEFAYEREHQPLPKLGPGVGACSIGSCSANAGKAGARAADADPDLRGAARRSAMRAATMRSGAMPRAGARSSGAVTAAALCR